MSAALPTLPIVALPTMNTATTATTTASATATTSEEERLEPRVGLPQRRGVRAAVFRDDRVVEVVQFGVAEADRVAAAAGERREPRGPGAVARGGAPAPHQEDGEENVLAAVLVEARFDEGVDRGGAEELEERLLLLLLLRGSAVVSGSGTSAGTSRR